MGTNKIKVFAFGTELVEMNRRNGKFGTARNYERTLNSFGTFVTERKYVSSGRTGAKDISFSLMTGGLLIEYERWLSGRGVVRNSSSFYMRNLRSIFNKAVAVGAAAGCNPFAEVYTGIDKTRKKAADEDLIMRMMRMDLHHSSSLAMTRDIFLFSYCTRGMAFVDVAFLRKDNICDGAISYIRRKTGQRLTIRMEPCIELIVRRYAHETASSPYVFPIITSIDPKAAYMQYRVALNYHNRKLKRLAAVLGERPDLSTYTARHTWATTARNYNVPLSVISAGMGHASEKTTQIYLAALEESVIDKANSGILGKLNSVVSA